MHYILQPDTQLGTNPININFLISQSLLIEEELATTQSTHRIQATAKAKNIKDQLENNNIYFKNRG